MSVILTGSIGTYNSTGTVTNYGFAHTVPVGTDILLVHTFITYHAIDDKPSSVKFNNQEMTELAGAWSGYFGFGHYTWYLIDPPAGAYTCSVTASSASGHGGVAANFANVNTSHPFRFVETGSQSGFQTASLNVSSSTDDLVYMWCIWNDPSDTDTQTVSGSGVEEFNIWNYSGNTRQGATWPGRDGTNTYALYTSVSRGHYWTGISLEAATGGGSPVTVTPSPVSATATGINPTVIGGSISYTPSPASAQTAGVDPTVSITGGGGGEPGPLIVGLSKIIFY